MPSRVDRIRHLARTTNLAPEAYELRRLNKIAHLDRVAASCGTSCSIWKSCSTFAVPIDLAILFANFRVETKFNAGKIKPVYIGVVKKVCLFWIFWIYPFILQWNTLDWNLLTFVNICQHVSTNVNIWLLQMLTYVNICSHMLTYVDIC